MGLYIFVMKGLIRKGAHDRSRKSPSKQAIVVLNSLQYKKEDRERRGGGGDKIRCIFVHGSMIGGSQAAVYDNFYLISIMSR